MAMKALPWAEEAGAGAALPCLAAAAAAAVMAAALSAALSSVTRLLEASWAQVMRALRPPAAADGAPGRRPLMLDEDVRGSRSLRVADGVPGKRAFRLSEG